MKSAGVLRWGGYGDMLMASIVFPHLVRDGYNITLYGTDGNLPVVKYDPFVGDVISIEAGSLDKQQYQKYWNECESKHDKWINFSGSIEGQFLKVEGSPDFDISHDIRHQVCNVNYYDWTMMWAGYPDVKGQNVQMFFSPEEIFHTRQIVKKHKGMFKIMWVLSGSSPHKSWPYTEIVTKALLYSHEDVVVYFVGDAACELLINRNWISDGDGSIGKRLKVYCGKHPIRTTLSMAHMADLVIGPETGVLNAVGGHPMGKIILLSHSSPENLTKYWVNTTTLYGDVPCYPCHQLHYSASSCECHKGLESPICQVEIRPLLVADAIEKYYEEWKSR